ncbi:Six-bladed beta-propeller, TolB-like protein [Drechmeria coniospora]|uniref:Six-bladed beta-propeller, TolB-like protein n=1 Tax=Drechmeria coniospora TaxID=98403 RepID=A0A151GKL0_DRECN|nr:Six-bladed beta-propeller, TolB-like protein [Drechmeria coniospora]KYK57629.1 Six-bladed beta-propeller, TolB-like protein [Drechmeria coniospora]
MGLSSAFLLLALAALTPFLYERSQVLVMFYNNAPERLVKINTFKSHSVKFADRIRSCEDVLLLEDEGIAVLACDPGRERWNTVMGVFAPGPVAAAGLYVYDYKVAADEDALRSIELVNFTTAADFHTLGMAYDKTTSTLYVSNHAKAGPRIETFKLSIGELTATHTRTIQHTLINGPNAIALINSDEFYVSNDHYFTATWSKALSKVETYLALPLGTVVHVKTHGGETRASVVARLPFANGIEILNSTTVAVASTSGSVVNLYDARRDGSLTYRSRIRVPFLPDNMSLSGGKLLIAGHPHPPALTKFTETRRICNDPDALEEASSEMKEYCAVGNAPSAVAEWSESTGLRMLYLDTLYPTSATAVRDVNRGVGIVSGLYAKGVLVWRN